MPGSVALIALALFMIAGAIASGIGYLGLRVVSPRREVRWAGTIGVGLAAFGLLYWDYFSFEERDLTLAHARRDVGTALSYGARFEAGYHFVQDISSGKYYRLRMGAAEFDRFLQARRHEIDQQGGPYVIEGGDHTWGPSWADGIQCPTMRSYRPDYTLPKSRPIDDYEIDFCPETETLYLTKIRI